MIEVTVKVEGCCHHDPPRKIVPRLGPFREQSSSPPSTSHTRRTLKKRNLIMAFTMTVTQQVDVTIEVKDKRGNPASVDGVPVWATDNTDLLTLTPSADGMTCTVAAVGVIGTANVQVTCDADLGAGTTPLIGTLEVGLTAGPATVITVTPGTPTEQP